MTPLRHRLHHTALIVAVATASLGLAPQPARADGGDSPADTDSSIDVGTLRDDIHGTLVDPAKRVRVTFFATEGSKLTLDLRGEDDGAGVANGLSLVLCDEAGNDLGIAGTKQDKSKPERNQVKWKNVALPTTQTYSLYVAATSAGGFRLKLKGTASTVKTVVESEEELDAGDTASADFDGQEGGAVKVKLVAAANSRFKGELVSIQAPDGSFLPGVRDEDRSKFDLPVDGTYTVTFQNTSTKEGNWKITMKAKPPKSVKRVGYLSPDGVAWVPKVKSLDPPKGVHTEQFLHITLTGLNLQEGLDVRLVRKGREDILGTEIDLVSDTEVQFTLDLDTLIERDVKSTGSWTVGLWNVPEYTTPGDRDTLVKNSETKSQKKKFQSVAAGSVTLPPGYHKDTEVWHLDFLDSFQNDLDTMGFGSDDPVVRDQARTAVEAYTLLYLRHLFVLNETTGNVRDGESVPVSFILDPMPVVAGKPGETYSRIQIGGTQQEDDLHDPDEPLAWGFAAQDPGNTEREDLTVFRDDSTGTEVRVGLGARTGVLDPTIGSAASSWILATSNLRNQPLGVTDRRYFAPGFFPNNSFQAERYRDIVLTVERASREIAAIVAHHIGKSMGLMDGGLGPMANPIQSGNFWEELSSQQFIPADINTLRFDADDEADYPGKSKKQLDVSWFPLVSQQTYTLPDLVTDVSYRAEWQFTGGRPNAIPSDYRVQYILSQGVPFGLDLSYQAIFGTIPTLANDGTLNCKPEPNIFAIVVTDTVRNREAFFVHRLNVLPNLALVPQQLRAQAEACRNAILNTP